MDDELIISNEHDLSELIRPDRKYKRIYLQLPQLSVDENVRWTKIINAEYNCCGINTGTFYITVSITLGCTLMIIYFLVTDDIPLPYIKYWALLTLLMGIIGKYTGTFLARARLNKIIESLSKVIRD